MKIVLTGAGGGHFVPLIAVVQEIDALVKEHGLVRPELYYLSNHPYDEATLKRYNIKYKHVEAGKMRTYFSLKNGSDFLKTLIGVPTALRTLYKLYPDIIFSKGGYVTVPVVMAARILQIPVFVHDSDSVPGRANIWAGKFAERVGISYPEAADFFVQKAHIAHVGNPVRAELRTPAGRGGHEQFGLQPDLPTLLFIGGSQGAEALNTVLLQALPDLLQQFQVVHVTGKEKYDAFSSMIDMEVKNDPNIGRYKSVPYLEVEELKQAYSAADLIVSRAGSGSIFEIACAEKPAILIPIPEDVSRDQRSNAYAYARAGGALVIEQENMTPHVLLSEAVRILTDTKVQEDMRAGARAFARPQAAHTIAEELLRMVLEHEQ